MTPLKLLGQFSTTRYEFAWYIWLRIKIAMGFGKWYSFYPCFLFSLLSRWDESKRSPSHFYIFLRQLRCCEELSVMILAGIFCVSVITLMSCIAIRMFCISTLTFKFPSLKYQHWFIIITVAFEFENIKRKAKYLKNLSIELYHAIPMLGFSKFGYVVRCPCSM